VRGEVFIAADEAEDRRDGDDRTASRRPEQRNGALAVEEHRAEIGVEHRIPRLLGTGFHGAVAEPPTTDAMRADEHVEAIERAEDRVSVVLEVDAAHREAGRFERSNRGRPDAPRGAGDDG
jgi:hypothetical protein